MLIDGRTILDLPDGLSCAAPRSWARSGSSCRGFTEGMVDRLKAMGLISEIITWKLRLFVPTGANGPAILANVMERYPLVRLTDRAAGRPCRRTPPNWPTVSRAMPRRCAATISPTAIARAATGWSAMSPTRRAAACSSA